MYLADTLVMIEYKYTLAEVEVGVVNVFGGRIQND